MLRWVWNGDYSFCTEKNTRKHEQPTHRLDIYSKAIKSLLGESCEPIAGR